MVAFFRSRVKRIAITGFTVILFLVFYQAVAHAEGLKLSAARVEGDVGEQVVINVTASNAAGTKGGQFTLSFDPTLVRPVSLEAGELVTAASDNLYMANLEYAAGELIYLWVTVMADTADAGVVCTITFELLKGGQTELRFRDVIVAPDDFGVGTSVPGRITVVGTAGVDREEGEDEDNSFDEPGEDEEDVGDEENEADGDAPEEVTGEDNGLENGEENGTEDDVSSGNNILLIGAVSLVILTVAGFAAIKIFKKSAQTGKH